MIAQGWNVRYAGASKLIPELFYTVIFLASPSGKYKESFRFAEIVLHALTACVAYCAMLAVDAGTVPAVATALAFLALSSEPDFGSYFECAEHFEPIFQFISFGAITLGIWHSDPFILGAGIFALLGLLLGFALRARRTLPPAPRRAMIQEIVTVAALNIGLGLMVPFVDNAAHVGGFAGGLALSMVLRPRRASGYAPPETGQIGSGSR
jgi:hypothetical protein